MPVSNVIAKLFGAADRPQSAADLRALLTTLDVDAAEARVAELERKRSDLLLAGEDAEIDAIDREITTANRDVERTAARRAEVERLLADAEAGEIQAAKAARADAAAAKGAAAGKALADRYESLARQIVGLVIEIARADIEIVAANAGLPDGCDPIVHPEASLRGRVESLAATLVLPSLLGEVPIWRPAGHTRFHGEIGSDGQLVLDAAARLERDRQLAASQAEGA